jgi:uncharacterized protein YbjT (DUF2867 family)
MSTNSHRILVSGATGFVAGQLIPRLLGLGHEVRAMARQPKQLAARSWSRKVEVVAGDVLAPQTLRQVMHGVDTAYYLIHGMTGGRGYAQRDLVAARNFAQAAADAGVQHIIYLGALADPDQALGSHLRSRIDTGAALRQGPVAVTEFRVGVIAGPGSISFQMIRRVTEVLPFIPANRWLQHKTQPIAAQNVVDYLVAALDNPGGRGRIFEIGGPEVTTYAELLQRYARVAGLKRRVVLIPGLPVWLMALGIALLTPVPQSVARAIVGGLSCDSRVTHGDALRTFSEVKLIDFSSAARDAVAKTRREDGSRRLASGLGWFGVPAVR